VAQFVAQPWDWSGNVNRFALTYAPAETVSYAFRWLPDRVEFRSWRGGPQDEAPGTTIHSWTYTGVHIPRPDQPRVHINMWQFTGPPTSRQEVVFDAFTFIPDCIGPHCTPVAVDLPSLSGSTGTYLAAPRPNPFRPSTTLRYTLPRDGHVVLAVYDVGGRRVRTLVNGYAPAGDHAVDWNGRDGDAGRVPPGVYLVRLHSGDILETQRVVLLK
jgi:hypothetical protein